MRNKKGGISRLFLCLIALFVLCLALVPVAFAVAQLGEASTKIITCEDSDAWAEDPYSVQGTVTLTGTRTPFVPKTDSCADDGKTLNEFSCPSEGGVKVEPYVCPNGCDREKDACKRAASASQQNRGATPQSNAYNQADLVIDEIVYRESTDELVMKLCNIGKATAHEISYGFDVKNDDGGRIARSEKKAPLAALKPEGCDEVSFNRNNLEMMEGQTYTVHAKIDVGNNIPEEDEDPSGMALPNYNNVRDFEVSIPNIKVKKSWYKPWMPEFFNPNKEITEQVACLFKDSDSYQECYSDDGEYLCPSEVGSCSTTISGPKGKEFTWKSSCGGSEHTVLDGDDETAVFFCNKEESPSIVVDGREIIIKTGNGCFSCPNLKGESQCEPASCPIDVPNVDQFVVEGRVVDSITGEGVAEAELLSAYEFFPERVSTNEEGYFRFSVPASLQLRNGPNDVQTGAGFTFYKEGYGYSDTISINHENYDLNNQNMLFKTESNLEDNLITEYPSDQMVVYTHPRRDLKIISDSPFKFEGFRSMKSKEGEFRSLGGSFEYELNHEMSSFIPLGHTIYVESTFHNGEVLLSPHLYIPKGIDIDSTLLLDLRGSGPYHRKNEWSIIAKTNPASPICQFEKGLICNDLLLIPNNVPGTVSLYFSLTNNYGGQIRFVKLELDGCVPYSWEGNNPNPHSNDLGQGEKSGFGTPCTPSSDGSYSGQVSVHFVDVYGQPQVNNGKIVVPLTTDNPETNPASPICQFDEKSLACDDVDMTPEDGTDKVWVDFTLINNYYDTIDITKVELDGCAPFTYDGSFPIERDESSTFGTLCTPSSDGSYSGHVSVHFVDVYGQPQVNKGKIVIPPTTDNPNTCTDTDGDDYYTQGMVSGYDHPSGRFVQMMDDCEYDTINEYVCDGIYGWETEFPCPSGCRDGACLASLEDFPLPFIKNDRVNGFFVVGSKDTEDFAIASNVDPENTRLASEIEDIRSVNSIIIGGPCGNAAAAAVLGNPGNCAKGFEPNVGIIKLIDHENGKYSLLVAGYTGADTLNAWEVLANYNQYEGQLAGNEVKVMRVNGKLVVEGQCSDSDGGFNVYEAGEAGNGHRSSGDYCDFASGSMNTLYEAYCENGVVDRTPTTCPPNAPYCNKGACSQTKPQCTDTDGGIDSSFKGTITEPRIDIGPSYEDYCENTQSYEGVKNCEGNNCGLREFYCETPYKVTTYEDFSCPNGCSNGACLEYPSTVGTYKINTLESNSPRDECNSFEGIDGEICATTQTLLYEDSTSNKVVFVHLQKITKDQGNNYIGLLTKNAVIDASNNYTVYRTNEPWELFWLPKEGYNVISIQEAELTKTSNGGFYSYPNRATTSNAVTQYFFGKFPPDFNQPSCTDFKGYTQMMRQGEQSQYNDACVHKKNSNDQYYVDVEGVPYDHECRGSNCFAAEFYCDGPELGSKVSRCNNGCMNGECVNSNYNLKIFEPGWHMFGIAMGNNENRNTVRELIRCGSPDDKTDIVTAWAWNKESSKWYFRAPNAKNSNQQYDCGAEFATRRGYVFMSDGVIGSFPDNTGFMLNVQSDVSYRGLSTSISNDVGTLALGWNLITYRGVEEKNPYQVALDYSQKSVAPMKIATMWALDEDSWNWEFAEPSSPTEESYRGSNGFLPMRKMAFGKAYWINVEKVGGYTPTESAIVNGKISGYVSPSPSSSSCKVQQVVNPTIEALPPTIGQKVSSDKCRV